MVVLDLLGRRWTLRVLWELRDDALTFRDLQAACGEVSPSVLNRRLRELRSAGIVEHMSGHGYRLTEHGERLLEVLGPLTRWAEDWARQVRDQRA